jgi:hypothetical protein
MLLKGKWKPVSVLLLVVLLGFLHPFGPPDFVYGNWDNVIALALLYATRRTHCIKP